MDKRIKNMKPQQPPLCSVCIANYNGEKYLASCIDSVLAQDFDFPIEIVIHDDASSDRSVGLINKRYPQVNLITSDENVGFCISNNRMVDVAQGTFILLLNNDAKLHKDALATLYNASVHHGDGIFGLPQYNSQTRELIDMGSLFDPFLNPLPNIDHHRQDVGFIIGACLWLPKILWENLGGFPDWFDSLAEDMYICCLARLQGYRVLAIPHSGFDHWVGRSLGGGKVLSNKRLSTTLKRRAKSERNKSFVMIVCTPSPLVWFIVPIHLFLLCMEGIMLSFIKLDRRLWSHVYGNCMKEIWRAKHKLKMQRHLVQITRQCSLTAYMRPFQFMPHKLRMLIKHGLPHVAN